MLDRTFRPYEPQQQLLLPPSLQEWLPADHLVWFISATGVFSSRRIARQIEENIGQWNEAERLFDWQLVNGPPGSTRTSTTRRLDNDVVESRIVAKMPDGKTHMDLTIKSTRRK